MSPEKLGSNIAKLIVLFLFIAGFWFLVSSLWDTVGMYHVMLRK